MVVRTNYALCVLCEANCGIAVEHDGSRVLRIRGDAQDPFSHGHICPKGVALADLQNDPDRLRQPMRRRGDRWEKLSWSEALDETAQRIVQAQERHGFDAIGVYTGNPTLHDYSATLMLPAFYESLGTRNRFSSISVDALPRFLTSAQLYDNQLLLPVPDIDRTDFMLIIGANPIVSNGSGMTAPDVAGRLRRLRERGGKLVVIDPRRTETARIADRHHFIRPGTDALLLAALLHTLFAEQRAEAGPLLQWLDGFEEIPRRLAPFAAERVANEVGIEAESIIQLAHEFAAAPSAVCHGRFGTCVQDYGTVATWLIDVLNIATGNLDRPGGAMFTQPAVDMVALSRRMGQSGQFDRWRSRVRGLPEFNGELPSAALAEEIETPGSGRIRALVTHSGNPVLALPNGRRLERALEQLDFMVAIDIYCNETTRHADLILPPTFGLERDHYPLIGHTVGVRNTAHWAPAVLTRPEGALHHWEILRRVMERMDQLRGAVKGSTGRMIEPKDLLRLLLRTGPRATSLAKLERHPHGIDFGPLEPRLPALLGTEGRIRLAPQPMMRDLSRLEAKLERERDTEEEPLVLISRRTMRSNNSWMHNIERLVRGPDRCVLLMHEHDAERRGLGSGQRVTIKSPVGQIEVPLEVSDEVMPGVVSLPHGWGHDRHLARLRVAARKPGASINDVLDDSHVDAVSGTADLGGTRVTVAALAAAAASSPTP